MVSYCCLILKTCLLLDYSLFIVGCSVVRSSVVVVFGVAVAIATYMFGMLIMLLRPNLMWDSFGKKGWMFWVNHKWKVIRQEPLWLVVMDWNEIMLIFSYTQLHLPTHFIIVPFGVSQSLDYSFPSDVLLLSILQISFILTICPHSPWYNWSLISKPVSFLPIIKTSPHHYN